MKSIANWLIENYGDEKQQRDWKALNELEQKTNTGMKSFKDWQADMNVSTVSEIANKEGLNFRYLMGPPSRTFLGNATIYASPAVRNRLHLIYERIQEQEKEADIPDKKRTTPIKFFTDVITASLYILGERLGTTFTYQDIESIFELDTDRLSGPASFLGPKTRRTKASFASLLNRIAMPRIKSEAEAEIRRMVSDEEQEAMKETGQKDPRIALKALKKIIATTLIMLTSAHGRGVRMGVSQAPRAAAQLMAKEPAVGGPEQDAGVEAPTEI